MQTIITSASPAVNHAPESFADALLEAVQTGLLPDLYEPSASDWSELEEREAMEQLMADEAGYRGLCDSECDHAGSFLGHDDSSWAF